MKLSNAPGKLLLPFANAGAKNSIPVASQIGITAGAASLTDGFPPLTRTPIAAGGVPPSGLDMNGILYALSAALRWANAGGGYVYDSTFANDSNVTGYPKGARVLRSDGAGYWLNTIDGNTVDPESVTVNQAQIAGWVPDLTNGVAAVTMTSANVTLTPLQYGKPIIVLSGTLTANLNLIFPNLAGEWTVVNNCAGAFTVTAKTAAGTGITLGSGGKIRIIWGNGTNIYGALNAGDSPAQFDNSTLLATTAFIRQAGMQAKGVTPIEGDVTLTAADVGMVRLCQSFGNFTVTLPLAEGLPEGTRIELFCASPNVTIQRQGGDVIHVTYRTTGAVSSLIMGVGDSLTLIAASSAGGWLAVGQPQLYASSRFAASRGTNGYTVQPDGTIRQYGAVTTSGSADVTVSLPIAFPTGTKSIVATYVNGTTSTAAFASIGSYGANSFNVGGWNSTSGTRGAITVFWEAVGF